MDLSPLSPPSPLHLKPAGRANWKPCGMGVFMAPCRMLPQSHMLLQTGFSAPKVELKRSHPHFPPHILHDQTSLAHLFSKPVLFLWCNLLSGSRNSSLCFSSPNFLTLCVFFPRSSIALTMSRLRSKSKQGVAWYAARGREPPIPDPPPEVENLPVLVPITALVPAQPLCENTPDLSPLSNPYACRIEWFDTLGNSLGFAPPPPSPPRRPPPTPSPFRHPPTTSGPAFSPSSSSDSPLPAHPRPVCDRCDD